MTRLVTFAAALVLFVSLAEPRPSAQAGADAAHHAEDATCKCCGGTSMMLVAEEAVREFGPFGPFSAAELAALIGQVFMGGESMLLLGIEPRDWPVRSALRRIGTLIRQLEERRGPDDNA